MATLGCRSWPECFQIRRPRHRWQSIVSLVAAPGPMRDSGHLAVSCLGQGREEKRRRCAGRRRSWLAQPRVTAALEAGDGEESNQYRGRNVML